MGAFLQVQRSELGSSSVTVQINGRVSPMKGDDLVNYLRQSAIDGGTPAAQAYNTTLRLMAGLLVVGFACNWLVKLRAVT